MTTQLTTRLTRELRFGFGAEAKTESLPNATNGFAGEPIVEDLMPYWTLRATLTGAIDPATGMLLNIKIVDRVMRDRAIRFLRDAILQQHLSPATAIRRLFTLLRTPALSGKGEKLFGDHRLCALELGVSPWSSLTCREENADMVELSLRFEFSAAHRLHADSLSHEENEAVFGRCNNPNGHGHNYEVEVTVRGTPTNNSDTFPIRLLQKIVNETLINRFDHKHLNMDCPEFANLNPTVEQITQVFFGMLQNAIPAPATLARLRVWETPKTMCEVTAP